jgi:hypothetical protein
MFRHALAPEPRFLCPKRVGNVVTSAQDAMLNQKSCLVSKRDCFRPSILTRVLASFASSPAIAIGHRKH